MPAPDPHTMWLRQLHGAHGVASQTLLRLISETPATSLPGIRAQLTAVVLTDGGDAAAGRTALRNAVFTLDALLAEGRA